jgi:hypothetical protein
MLVRNVFYLEQGYKLQLSQSKVLRRILGTKKVAVSKGFQTLYSEQLHRMGT